jgi:undecaprenyl-diphosphatase
MFPSIQAIDNKILLAINNHNTLQLDAVMWFASQTESWVPFYVLLAILLVVVYKKDSLLMILMVLPLVLVTDQLSSSIIRPLFHRPRPSHSVALQNLLHYVNGYHGGNYGFISSHACNTFGLATYISIITYPRLKWIPFVLYPWAVFVSYSRIYLGVHYPSDIVVAALLGMFIGWCIARLHAAVERRRTLRAII